MPKKPRKHLSFDERISRARKRKGISEAYAHAGIEFRIKAHEGGIWFAKRREIISCDDIQAWMLENYPNITPLHKNAWGGVMTALAADGIVTKLNQTVKTRRILGHHREINVWKSHIYEGARRVNPRQRKNLDPNQLDIFNLPEDRPE